MLLQRKSLQAEELEKPSLKPEALVFPAVGQIDRLGVGLDLGQTPRLDIVDELRRFARIDGPFPSEPDIRGGVEGVGVDIEVVDDRRPETDIDQLGASRMVSGGRGHRVFPGGSALALRDG